LLTRTSSYSYPPDELNSESKSSSEKIIFYLDASESMRGFVRLSGNQPIEEFVYKNLISKLSSIAYGDFELFKFGSYIEQIKEIQSAAEEFFSDKSIPEQTEKKDFYAAQKSNISKVIEKAKEEPENLSIVITDLFMSDRDLKNESGLMIRPLVNIIENENAIGILGIRSRFNGTIYKDDVPNMNESYYHSGFMPFYLIMIGKDSHIRTFYERLEKEVLIKLNKDKNEYHFFIFSSDLFQKSITMNELYNTKCVETGDAFQSFLIQRPYDNSSCHIMLLPD